MTQHKRCLEIPDARTPRRMARHLRHETPGPPYSSGSDTEAIISHPLHVRCGALRQPAPHGRSRRLFPSTQKARNHAFRESRHKKTIKRILEGGEGSRATPGAQHNQKKKKENQIKARQTEFNAPLIARFLPLWPRTESTEAKRSREKNFCYPLDTTTLFLFLPWSTFLFFFFPFIPPGTENGLASPPSTTCFFVCAFGGFPLPGRALWENYWRERGRGRGGGNGFPSVQNPTHPFFFLRGRSTT